MFLKTDINVTVSLPMTKKWYTDDWHRCIREKAYAAKAAEKRKADEVAIAFLKEGLSIEMISRCINIPLEHVKELAEQKN